MSASISEWLWLCEHFVIIKLNLALINYTLMQIKTLLTTILTIAVLGAHSQVVINEFQPGTDQVEIKNTGDTEISVANFFLCSFPVYNELNELTIESGDLMLSPGEIVVLSGHAMGDMDDELGLYIMPSYANPDAIIDYVEWGSTGHQRSSVAQAAGIWGMGDFIPTVNPGESIQWDGLGDSSSNWFQGPDTFGAENGGCEVEGGDISTMDPTEICAGDGIADPINVTLEGNSGANSAWVITDESGTILELPPGPPFDLEEAGEGTCLIWNISFEDGLLGAEVGENTADLEGCYALSNPVTVIRNGIAGGTVSTDDGETLVTVTVGDGNADEFTFASADNQGANFVFIITEEDGTILDILDGNTADFEGAPAGICHVYGFSYYGDIVGDAGDNVDDLASTEGCSQISENFVIIDRQPVGVDENLIGNLEIWPNPASQTLNIQLPSTLRVGQLSIYNAQGQNVWTDSINGSGNLQVDVSHLAKGAYHLHLTNGVNSFRSTLLKQ